MAIRLIEGDDFAGVYPMGTSQGEEDQYDDGYGGRFKRSRHGRAAVAQEVSVVAQETDIIPEAVGEVSGNLGLDPAEAAGLEEYMRSGGAGRLDPGVIQYDA